MAQRTQKLRVGDVFTIPLDDERVGLGQIVERWGDSGGHFYLAVFAEIHPRAHVPAVDKIVAGEIAFLALSMDALLKHGHWEVVGHRDVEPSDFPWPAFKEAIAPGEFHLVDHTGDRRRPATETESEQFPFRSVVAPIVLERALQATHGIGVWDPADDQLRPAREPLTAEAAFG